MDVAVVVRELEAKYPGKNIIRLAHGDAPPHEIVCEFDPPDQHPEWSMCMAVIDKTQPHFHKRMTEVYNVVRGELTLHVGNQEYIMYEGQSWTVLPGQVHWAEGDGTWVEVYASPAWCKEDHIFADP